MRRIAQASESAARTVKRALDQDRAGPRRRFHAGTCWLQNASRQSTRCPRGGHHRPAGPISRRHHHATNPRGVAQARLPGKLSLLCQRVRALHHQEDISPCRRSRPAGEQATRWITPPSTSTSRIEGRRRGGGVIYWVTRATYLHFVREFRTLATTIRQHIRGNSSTYAESRQSLFYNNMKVVVSRYDGDEPVYNRAAPTVFDLSPAGPGGPKPREKSKDIFNTPNPACLGAGASIPWST